MKEDVEISTQIFLIVLLNVMEIRCVEATNVLLKVLIVIIRIIIVIIRILIVIIRILIVIIRILIVIIRIIIVIMYHRLSLVGRFTLSAGTYGPIPLQRNAAARVQMATLLLITRGAGPAAASQVYPRVPAGG